jgi:hypothetical protein
MRTKPEGLLSNLSSAEEKKSPVAGLFTHVQDSRMRTEVLKIRLPKQKMQCPV